MDQVLRKSPRPRSLQYPLCVLHCDLGLTDSPPGTCVVAGQGWGWGGETEKRDEVRLVFD